MQAEGAEISSGFYVRCRASMFLFVVMSIMPEVTHEHNKCQALVEVSSLCVELNEVTGVHLNKW